MVAGGDINEVSATSPSLGTFFFTPIAGEDNTYDIGGIRSADDGKVNGAGELVNSLVRKVGMFELASVSNDSSGAQEYQAACALSGLAEDIVWTFSCLNGDIYKGVGAIQGDIKLNPNKATFAFKVVSGAGFELQ